MTNTDLGLRPSRRALLTGTGALIVSFSLGGAHAEDAPAAAPPTPQLPVDLKTTPMLDAWVRIDANGAVTIFTGKAELGQGIKTALIQVAAEELCVDPAAITLITADTEKAPNEGITSGSHSMQDSGTAIHSATAQVRGILIGLAATAFGVGPETLKAAQGAIVAADGRKLSYGSLVKDDVLHVMAVPTPEFKDLQTYSVVGTSMPRVDIPGKLTGGVSYVQDLRFDGMVHGRIVRPPSYGAKLTSVDTSHVETMPGVLKIVRDGNYLALIAEQEFQAVQAVRVLATAAVWSETPIQLDPDNYHAELMKLPSDDYVILDKGAPVEGGRRFEATFHRPFNAHGSIGPSCAVALMQDGKLTIWSHTQGVFPLRAAVAEMLHLPPPQVHCIHVEGAGCYGHNAADDVGADAALLARAFPGRPVRVQWMREDEHAWEPFGPAMTSNISAALDASGKIVDWRYDVFSNTHSTRPPGAGNLLAAWYLAEPFAQPVPKPIPMPEGGGDRNAIPIYTIANAHVTHHFIKAMPIRVSALRGLGAYTNVFSIESFMDELALAAGADPVEFRLRHLDDPRARDVVTLAAEQFGWSKGKAAPAGHGYGFAFARYKNLAAYCAIAVDIEVDHETGRVRLVRAVAAVDSGQAVNPDGIRNQIEGAIIQSTSWTLYEEVSFDKTGIKSRNWGSYPILRFPDLPDTVEVHVIDRSGQPYLGTGEAGQGPTSAALANALANATGARLRDLPLSREKVKRAIGV
jgi:CO/xanthine dehydrogenase Mo-binding subunit